jgi:pimeloyl-ACP methyl ester carboxylesterase
MMWDNFIEDGLYIRQVTISNISRKNILYIHGLGESGLGFNELIKNKRLNPWSHFIVDLAGYGKSPWEKQALTLEGHADHLANWLQHRKMKNLVVLGHSMGGVIGLILCEKYPHLVDAFINVEGNISIEDCGFSKKIAAYSLDDLIDHGLENIKINVYHDGIKDKALRLYYPSLSFCDPDVLHLNATALVEISQTDRLAMRQGDLKIPHIYILGKSGGTGKYSQQLLTAAGVEWRPIEDASHWPFIDQPERFIPEMLRFLNKFPNSKYSNTSDIPI